MNKNSFSFSPQISGAGDTPGAFPSPPEFKLLIAYDDFANGRGAMRFLEGLMEECGKLFTFIPHLLRFEHLVKPHVAQQMGRDAALADMVVIAAYGDADLPVPVKDWLGKLEPRKGNREGTLVALLSSSKKGNTDYSPAQKPLSEAARRSKRKFLCNPIDWPATEAAFPVEITWRLNRRANEGSRQGESPA